jgi:predicted nucleic-acid-binding protein
MGPCKGLHDRATTTGPCFRRRAGNPRPGGAWISHIVLVETPSVLSAAYDIGHAAIATAVEMLLSHRSLTVQDGDVVMAALETYRRRPSLGFSDCLVLEVARKAGHTPLGTFDRKLGRVPGAQRL